MTLRKKRFTIDVDTLNGIEIAAFLLEEDAKKLEKAGAGNVDASDMTRMSMGDVKAVAAIRGLAEWLRMAVQRTRK